MSGQWDYLSMDGPVSSASTVSDTKAQTFEDGACCAHLHIEWKTEQLDNGLTRGWWECALCHYHFAPVAALRAEMEQQIVSVSGKRYTYELLRSLSETPVGQCFRIEAGEGDKLIFHRVEMEQGKAQAVDEAVREGERREHAMEERANAVQASLEAQGLETARIAAREKALRERLEQLLKVWDDSCIAMRKETREGLLGAIILRLEGCADQLRAILEETK